MRPGMPNVFEVKNFHTSGPHLGAHVPLRRHGRNEADEDVVAVRQKGLGVLSTTESRGKGLVGPWRWRATLHLLGRSAGR